MSALRELGGGGPIDVHTHVVPASIPAYSGARSGVSWPSLEHHRSCCARVMIAGKLFREIDDNSWNVDRRSAEMQPMGIAAQLLSPMPELLSTWMHTDDAAELGRHVNGAIAEMVASAPSRFAGLGMVPLQAPERAAAELVRLVGQGFAGVEIGTNVEGRLLGDPMFEPFFTAAEESGAIIFVHPLRAIGRDRLVGPPGIEQVVAFPCETALAIASLITGGVLHRHPRLKLVFSHGGGAFAQLLPRLQHAWSFMPSIQEATGAAPEELARRLHYDSLVYSPLALRFLVDSVGASQVVLGTDYPYAILDRTPVASANAIGLSDSDLDAVCSGNIRRLLLE